MGWVKLTNLLLAIRWWAKTLYAIRVLQKNRYESLTLRVAFVKYHT